MTSSRQDPPAKSELSKLNDEIRECEEFVALCNQIRKLEQLAESDSQKEIQQKLAQERAQCLASIRKIEMEIQQDEAELNTASRPMGTLERDTLSIRISDKKKRVCSLQISADHAEKIFTGIETQVLDNAVLLESLYGELELQMEQGLHPNTVKERIESLKELRDTLSSAKRANIPRKADQANPANSTDIGTAPNEVPIEETEFFQYLAKDLSIAQSKVEIISPYISSERARPLLLILARLAADGKNVVVRTRPPAEHDEQMKQDAQRVITDSHKLRITMLQKSNLTLNIAIIDERICWEGTVSILGPSQPGNTMRRVMGTKNVRQLRLFLDRS
jgi:hypothetical protein